MSLAATPTTADVRAVISGFDSAWTTRKRGAISSIVVTPDGLRVLLPELASFAEAPAVLARHGEDAAVHLIALDQPCVVTNETGSRPVDRAMAPLVSKLGGGVQPASRSRREMFGEGAPLWSFLEAWRPELDPHRAVRATRGRYLFEVYPVLATAGLFPAVLEEGRLRKYNPERRGTFRLADWKQLCLWCAEANRNLGAHDAVDFLRELAARARPRKADQDKLDSMLCALVGLRWWQYGLEQSLVLGDVTTGYVVMPKSDELVSALQPGAEKNDVPLRTVA